MTSSCVSREISLRYPKAPSAGINALPYAWPDLIHAAMTGFISCTEVLPSFGLIYIEDPCCNLHCCAPRLLLR